MAPSKSGGWRPCAGGSRGVNVFATRLGLESVFAPGWTGDGVGTSEEPLLIDHKTGNRKDYSR